ncbi:hypothetical protein HRD49_43090 [Corallococcus exiguus]|uniref:hypothetical protein n=1 Tax=Corallococcus exiguus TaxID=83462 RepID=UPI001560B560|nr:hypothetical protein [Corallococcus exiguus]NRD68530.1 hypothetical protein [Corallococcus exiguus]
MAARARILALTEDSGRQAQPTLQRILREALKLLVVGVDLNPTRIRIEPLPENDRARHAIHANQWKAQPPTRDTVILLGAIATRLLEPAGFVVFHFDTDRVWSKRESSENRQKFETIIQSGVRRILQGEGALPINPRARPSLTAAQVEAALSRLLILTPCYSIESWLYQATNELYPLCLGRHASQEHAQLIAEWVNDRTQLDEVHRPKDDVMACVADHHNETLARSFPAEDVWLAERSFHESVERLKACSALVEALAYPTP